jgi:YVTN family beta-propeller protein
MRGVAATVVAVAVSIAGVTAAGAQWSATGTGSEQSLAMAMPAGNQPTATVNPAGSTTVNVAWAPATGGAPVAGYDVRAYDATTGTGRAVGGTCAGTPAGTSCSDLAVPAGSWRYSVTPRQQAWAGAESPRSTAVTVEPRAATAFVVNQTSNSVTPINSATDTASSPIAVGTTPREIAISPDGTTAYVVNQGAGTVTPINVATGAAGTPVSVGSNPYQIAITPDGTTAFVTNQVTPGTVRPITLSTMTVGAPITVGNNPFGIAITPDGTTAFVANFNSNTVTPITVATRTAGTAITVGAGPRGIAITPDGATAFVTNQQAGTVTPITVATRTAGTAITVGSTPIGVAVTPDGATAFVANHNSNSVTPITVATRAAGTAIALGAGTAPHGVAVTPGGTRAYVTNEGTNTVTPITVATRTAGTPIAVGTGPNGIAIVPDQAPVASFTATTAAAGAPTSFDASASTVAYGTIASYAWNFGDGGVATTTGPTTTHTYASGGSYTATLTLTSSAGTSTTKVFTGQTVSRNGGPSATTTRSVTVNGPAATVTFPAANGVYNTTSWNAGCSSAICGTATATGASVAGVQVSVRQGTGNYWNGTSFASATEVLLGATGTTNWTRGFPAANFPSDGTYTVRAVVTDTNGATASTSTTFTIDRTAPTPTAVTFFNANGTINPTTDEVRITYSEPLSLSSICSAWTGTGDQTLGGSGVVVTITDQGGPPNSEPVSVTATGCTLHVGTIPTGLDWTIGNATFSGTGTNESRLTWTAATNTLTIHLGARTAGSLLTNGSTGTAVYNPDAAVTDRAGNSIATTPFNSAGQRF